MKKINKKTALALAISFIIGGSTFVGAETLMKNINAVQDASIKIKLNGEDFTPKEADGTINYPIIYQGRTYLPVRSIAEALKMQVDWDNQTRTVIIGSAEAASDIFVGRDQLFKPNGAKDNELMYYTSVIEDLNQFDYPTSYTSGIIGIINRNDIKIGVTTSGYKYLTGEACAKGKNTNSFGTYDLEEMRVNVYSYDPVTKEKGDKLGTIKIAPNKPSSFKIDVSNISQILLEVDRMEDITFGSYNFFNLDTVATLVLGNVKLEK